MGTAAASVEVEDSIRCATTLVVPSVFSEIP